MTRGPKTILGAGLTARTGTVDRRCTTDRPAPRVEKGVTVESGYFNNYQLEYMAELAKLAPEQKCACGWYKKEECPLDCAWRKGQAMSTNDEAAIRDIRDGWSFVFQQGALLAELPIEKWIEELERAETLGPILDPTLYRDYLWDGKGKVIKDVLKAALHFKAAIFKARDSVGRAKR